MWSLVLSGKRNLSFTNASRVSKILRTGITLWLDPEADPQERKGAWQKFVSQKSR